MLKRRVAMALFGVVVCAVSVGFFRISSMGVDPFQSFMSGLNQLVPIDFGALYIIANAVLLLFSLVTDRSRIGIATFLNLFLVGYITQFTHALLLTLLPAPSLPVRLLCLGFGVVTMCFGSAFYMTADLGVSTYDAVAIVLSRKWKLGQFQYIRILCDSVCILLGIAAFFAGGGTPAGLTNSLGVGTVITAFCMGPLIVFFNHRAAEPFLARKEKTL